MERKKERLSDLCIYEGIKTKDQNGTNFCHANSPALAVEILRAVMGCRTSNCRRVPGVHRDERPQRRAWIIDDLKASREHGFAPISMVPANFVGWTSGPVLAKRRRKYKVEEWIDFLAPATERPLTDLMTCLFRRLPVCTAHNWWSHAVTALDPVMKGKEFSPLPQLMGQELRHRWLLCYDGSEGHPGRGLCPRVATVGVRS